MFALSSNIDRQHVITTLIFAVICSHCIQRSMAVLICPHNCQYNSVTKTYWLQPAVQVEDREEVEECSATRQCTSRRRDCIPLVNTDNPNRSSTVHRYGCCMPAGYVGTWKCPKEVGNQNYNESPMSLGCHNNSNNEGRTGTCLQSDHHCISLVNTTNPPGIVNVTVGCCQHVPPADDHPKSSPATHYQLPGCGLPPLAVVAVGA
ncbi:hypothetical protein DdX_12436 [Ditylenchus destructor]|uniref:Uncharacterized protein n=1 Tax=Ditylenchus destructor TaxID=166010 RepID=A0AAD4R3L2_9BILA|nr:hypothetical protein DdX_12436 [Ditylenchus destructor]